MYGSLSDVTGSNSRNKTACEKVRLYSNITYIYLTVVLVIRVLVYVLFFTELKVN